MNRSGCSDPTAEIAISRAYKEWKRGQLREKQRAERGTGKRRSYGHTGKGSGRVIV